MKGIKMTLAFFLLGLGICLPSLARILFDFGHGGALIWRLDGLIIAILSGIFAGAALLILQPELRHVKARHYILLGLGYYLFVGMITEGIMFAVG